MRIAIGLEYDGSRFHGWQLQDGVSTVQQQVEEALSRVAGQMVRVHCAGRTDAGVHALCQVVHFDSPAVRPMRGWMLGANANLTDDVAVVWARQVRDDFHARFSAFGRTYRYLILNRAPRPGLMARRVTWVRSPLDDELMHRAGQALVGTHDFSAYRAQGCQAKTPVRTLTQLSVRRQGDYVELVVSANAFLHHMVRNIAGVLIAIGQGDAPPGWAGEVLAGGDRTLGGVTAPSDGLYFSAVDYPAAYGLPSCGGSLLLS